jgi:hypothetical protein
VLLSLATGACHDLEIAPYEGKGTGEKSLFRRAYKTLKPGDVVLVDSLFGDYFIACELRQLGVDLVAHAKYARAGSQLTQSGPEGEILVWQHPRKPRGMTREKYRSYPEQLVLGLRQFLLWGLEKVRMKWLWACTGYNRILDIGPDQRSLAAAIIPLMLALVSSSCP